MKKRLLALLLAAVMTATLLPVTSFASAGPARPELPNPTDLTWGKRNYEYDGSDTEDIPGYIQWRSSLHKSNFEITYYNAANDEPIFLSDGVDFASIGFRIEEDAPAEVVCSAEFFWDKAESLESGFYYFTVRTMGDGVTYADSEIARSDTWEYTKPEYHLNAPAALTWKSDGTFTLPAFGDRYFDSYDVNVLFSATDANATDVSELDGWGHLIWSGNDTIQIRDHLFDEDYGPGYYYLRVRALSNDITQVLPSRWSPLSGAYYYDGQGAVPGDEFVIENGVLTKYNGPGGDVVIPDGVTKIGYSAFMGCTNLTSVTIPSGVTRIGGSAFENCASLTSVTIPDSVTYIGIMAFKGCASLTGVIIPESVTTIESEAFRNCRGLTSLMIPGSVNEIRVDTFRGCTSLTDVVVGNGVTRIDDHVFLGCVNLISVTIPASVYYIAGGVFDAQTENTLTVYGYFDTQAEFYCTSHRIHFVSLGIAPATAQSGALTSASGENVSWSITETGEVSVDAAGLAPEEAVLVGGYDAQGRFTGVKWLSAENAAAQIDPDTPNVKLFWLGAAQNPLSPSATVWGK